MKRKTVLFLIFILISLIFPSCEKKVENTEDKSKVSITKKNSDNISKTIEEKNLMKKEIEENLRLLISQASSIFSVTPCKNKQIFDLTDGRVTEAINAYYSVLKNQSEMISAYTMERISLNQKKEVYPDSLKISLFAVVDLDNNGIPEVILPYTHLNTEDSHEFYNILYYKEEHVYCLVLANRQFEDVKIDGTFYFSGGACYSGIATLSFIENKQEGTPFTYNIFTYKEYHEQDPETGKWIDYDIIVNNQNATKDEFDSAFETQMNKPDVTWHKLTDSEVNQYFSK